MFLHKFLHGGGQGRVYIFAIVMIVLIFSQIVVNGNYVFKINLVSLINPTDRIATGECCVCCDIGGVCINQCDMVMRICLRPAGFSELDPSCPLVELRGPAEPRGINLGVGEPWPVRQSFIMVHGCMTSYTYTCILMYTASCMEYRLQACTAMSVSRSPDVQGVGKTL